MYASAASLSSLRVLQSVNKQIDASQTRLSTGYKVNSAAENGSVWAAAQGIRSDIGSYEAVSTSQDFTKGVFDVAAGGAEAIVSLLNNLATKVSSALGTASGSNERAAISAQITAIQKQLLATADDASFQGNNILNTATANKTYINSYSSHGVNTTATIATVNVKTDELDTAIATLTTATAKMTTFSIDTIMTDGDTTKLLTAINSSITNVTAYASKLGAASAAITSNQDIMKKISDIKQSALSSLIDTDMAEETTRLQALQVKQQLATQMLSMANSSQQNILRLFQ